MRATIFLTLTFVNLFQAVALASDVLEQLTQQSKRVQDEFEGEEDIRDLAIQIGRSINVLQEAVSKSGVSLPDAYEEILRTYLEGFQQMSADNAAKYLADVRDDLRIKILHARRKLEVEDLKGVDQSVRDFNFFGDTVVGLGDDGMITALDSRQGTVLWKTRLQGDTGKGFQGLSSGSNYVVGSETGHVIGLEPATGQKLWNRSLPSASKMYTGTSKLVGGGNDKGLIWFWKPGQTQWEAGILVEHEEPLRNFTAFSDNKRFAVVHGRKVSVWKTEGKKEKHFELPFDVNSIQSFPNSNRLLTLDESGQAAIWDWKKGSQLRRWRPHDGKLKAAKILEEDMLCTLGELGESKTELRIWSDANELLAKYEVEADVSEFAFNSSGNAMIATTSSGLKFFRWLLPDNPFEPIRTEAYAYQGENRLSGYRIWYVPKAHRSSEEKYRNFPLPTNDAVKQLPAGNYLCWAELAGETASEREYHTVTADNPIIGLTIIQGDVDQ